MSFTELECCQPTHADHHGCGANTQGKPTQLIGDTGKERAKQAPCGIGHVVEADIHRDPLCIGEAEDQRMPPAIVRAVYEGLPTNPDRKLLWICPDADHGSAFDTDFEGYRERVRELLALSK